MLKCANSNKLFKQVSGFTLIEMVIVIIIAGVLASLAIPRFTNVVERTRFAEGIQLVSALRESQQRYMLENNDTETSVLADLDITLPNMGNYDQVVIQTANDRIYVRRTGSLYRVYIYYTGANDGRVRCFGSGAFGGQPCRKFGADANGWMPS